VIGVDITAPAIERALDKAKGHKDGNLGFVHVDIETYHPGRKFDLFLLLSKQCVTFPAIDLAAVTDTQWDETLGMLPDPKERELVKTGVIRSFNAVILRI